MLRPLLFFVKFKFEINFYVGRQQYGDAIAATVTRHPATSPSFAPCGLRLRFFPGSRFRSARETPGLDARLCLNVLRDGRQTCMDEAFEMVDEKFDFGVGIGDAGHQQ